MKSIQIINISSLYILLFFLFVSLTSEQPITIDKVTLEINIPNVVFNKGKVSVSDNKKTFSIYTINQYNIYEFQVYGTDSLSNVINTSKKEYFIYKQGMRNGLFYSKYFPYRNQYNVDSVLKIRAFKGNEKLFELVNNFANDKRVNTLKDGVIEETFIIKNKKDRTFPDTLIYSYSKKFNSLRYSFSERIDKEHSGKLFKCRGVFNMQQYSGENITIPKRELLVEIKKDTVTNNKELFQNLDAFIQQKVNMH
ncbi:hypothetical protein [Arcicella rosea]|uniref:Uncharacterized protein n=1 Tax=Arcicella rosea TaxID=502909 RepID=A0A841EI47_9BACT|nr:hypothetical protein [Arcicella rosea]MBB6002845.1 hypothetical protein [Arcicella rosea]